MPLPEMHEIESSNIQAVGIDGTDLYIKFTSTGATYKYSGATEELYEGLVNAESPGRFFYANVKGKLEAEKVAVTAEEALS